MRIHNINLEILKAYFPKATYSSTYEIYHVKEDGFEFEIQWMDYPNKFVLMEIKEKSNDLGETEVVEIEHEIGGFDFLLDVTVAIRDSLRLPRASSF